MRKRSNKSSLSVAAAILFIFFVGCAHVEEEPAPEPAVTEESEITEETFVEPPVLEEVEEDPEETEPTEFIHTVQWPGETLSLIAKWYTGKVGLWQTLAKANPGLNPNRIFIGDQIRIPMDLMIKDKPMPKSVVRPAAPVSKPEPESESSEEPEAAVEPLPDEEAPPAASSPEDDSAETPPMTEEPPPAQDDSADEEPPPRIFGPKDNTGDSTKKD